MEATAARDDLVRASARADILAEEARDRSRSIMISKQRIAVLMIGICHLILFKTTYQNK